MSTTPEGEPVVIFSPIFGMGLRWPDGTERFAPPRIVCQNSLRAALREVHERERMSK